MPIYQTHGHLTGVIKPDGIEAAQAYLTQDHEGKPNNMEQYLDPWAKGVVESLDWRLEGDGESWNVRAFTTRELTDEELKKLSSEVSGQNSDGLGEGFEQQDFAETHDDGEKECGECNGDGDVFDDEIGVYSHCSSCDGNGYLEREGYGMISFDWETNDCTFVRIK